MGARIHWMTAAVSLAHANQLPLPTLQSAAGHESTHVNNAILASRLHTKMPKNAEQKMPKN